jgi:hypothetical protein
MRISTLSITGTAVVAAVHAMAAVNGPPEFDVSPSCRAADRVSLSAGADKPRTDLAACLDDERVAKEALVKAWTSFTPVVRAQCVGMNRTGGPPSYVELLTCLEVMRDAGTSE